MNKNNGAFLARGSALLLFVLPLAYCGAIFGVVIHEVIGHGLVALLFGGEFSGFRIKWDGMGSAFTSPHPDSPAWHKSAILLGGVLSNVLVGTALLASVSIFRSARLRIVILVLATGILLDSAGYTFWSALHPGTQGDAARIVVIHGSTGIQILLVALGAALILIGTTYTVAQVLGHVEKIIANGARLETLQRLIMIFSFFFVPSVVGYYLFDWNQLIRGIGQLPAHANVLFSLALSLLLLRWLPQIPENLHLGTSTLRSHLMVWGLALITFCTALFLADGIYW